MGLGLVSQRSRLVSVSRFKGLSLAQDYSIETTLSRPQDLKEEKNIPSEKNLTRKILGLGLGLGLGF